MLFYKITIAQPEEANEQDTQLTPSDIRAQQRKRASQICAETISFHEKDKERFLFVSGISASKCILGALNQGKLEKAVVERFLHTLKIPYTEYDYEEITLKELASMLLSASRNDYILDDDDVLQEYNLRDIVRCQHDYEENIVGNRNTRPMLLKKADALLSSSLKEELSRVFDMQNRHGFLGHPVHYLIESKDEEFVKAAKEILISALVKAGRIKSCRLSTVDISSLSDFQLNRMYHTASGGTMCIPFLEDVDDSCAMANGQIEDMENAARAMLKFQSEVLTIFCLPKACSTLKQMLFEAIHDCSFVEITEDPVDAPRAIAYLKERAKNCKLPLASLAEQIQDDRQYSFSELNGIFDRWLQRQLKTNVYPAYANIASAGSCAAVQKPKGSAYDTLQEMIGLSSAKKVINQALNFYKAQKLFSGKGRTFTHPSMHMVFTGNPGTAKTTVARLFARIMKDNGMLSVGNLYEVGRADLVGKYVGWTAKIVKEKFRQARGSVLFIDEAYSLVDDHSGMYGDEAINTIVQEMENGREDCIVIFAGYPKEMETFLSRNPGLRSRIAYHVGFENYSAEELYAITELFAKNKGVTLADDVRGKLLPIYEAACKQEDFGNGRFVRNMIERAGMKQASRLMQSDYSCITEKDAATFCAEDFEDLAMKKPAVQRIGFAQ